tara:strand:+ start:360 stop:920 length:561 start_codon:yes stop_codon:yes gene_type:complete
MFKKVRIIDTVEVPPAELGDINKDLIKVLLQEKLEGRVDESAGSIVTVTKIHELNEGVVLPGRPGVYYSTEFDAVTFDPAMQEVVDGTVIEVVEFGAFVGIGPIDGLLHVSQISDEYLNFNGENQQLASSESGKVLGVEDSVRTRIVTKSIDERNPRESKIGLTAKQPGLGKHGWLKDKREREESA